VEIPEKRREIDVEGFAELIHEIVAVVSAKTEFSEEIRIVANVLSAISDMPLNELANVHA
jgi:hypothetical protein